MSGDHGQGGEKPKPVKQEWEEQPDELGLEAVRKEFKRPGSALTIKAQLVGINKERAENDAARAAIEQRRQERARKMAEVLAEINASRRAVGKSEFSTIQEAIESPAGESEEDRRKRVVQWKEERVARILGLPETEIELNPDDPNLYIENRPIDAFRCNGVWYELDRDNVVSVNAGELTAPQPLTKAWFDANRLAHIQELRDLQEAQKIWTEHVLALGITPTPRHFVTFMVNRGTPNERMHAQFLVADTVIEVDLADDKILLYGPRQSPANLRTLLSTPADVTADNIRRMAEGTY